MRRAARIDNNHVAIVRALRDVGASVQSLASQGQGCPDILCGYRGSTYVMEIKDGDKSASRRMLTVDEMNWRDNWRGQYDVVTCIEDALKVIGALE